MATTTCVDRRWLTVLESDDTPRGRRSVLVHLRSKGQAHRSDTGRAKLLAAEGSGNLTVPQQFDEICDRVSAALVEMTDLIGANADALAPDDSSAAAEEH